MTDATSRYLVLIDISGYTPFLAGVEQQHGEDFSAGLPAGYRVLGELIDGLIEGLAPDVELVKVEGDAVFGAASAEALDGRGTALLERLGALYRAFTGQRDRLAVTATDDKCTACFAVATLDIKVVVHRGFALRSTVGGRPDLSGPAVNLAHRLLKNTVRERIGHRPYAAFTEAAAAGLGIAGLGIAHHEDYPDAGAVDLRVIDLADVAGVPMTTWLQPLPTGGEFPEIRIVPG